MRFISHRGNLNGSVPKNENSLFYIDNAINNGFDVEVDLRSHLGLLYFGHDFADHLVTEEWINERKDRLWIHCKDRNALEFCIDNSLHCFFHSTDDYTITSKGFVWGYPGTLRASQKGIFVLPEKVCNLKMIDELGYYGICSDKIQQIKEMFNAKTN